MPSLMLGLRHPSAEAWPNDAATSRAQIPSTAALADAGRSVLADTGHPMHRILFIGNNSVYSAAHLIALGRTSGVAAVVAPVANLGGLKRLERRLTPSRLGPLARELGAQFLEVGHKDDPALVRVLSALRPDLVVVVGMGW